MKPKYPFRQHLGLIIVVCAAASLPQSASAAAYDWIGATNTTWDAGWTGGSVPAISDDLTIFGPLNAAGALNINVAGSAFANTLSFTNTAATTLTNTTSGADKTLALQGGLTTGSGGLTIGSSTANQGVLIVLGASQTWNIGSGGLTANNIISGTGFGLTKIGEGTLTLSGANTYSGGTTVSQGTLLVGNAAGAGTGTVTLNGGTLGATAAGFTITNAIVANTGTTSIIGGTGFGTLTLSGALSGSGALQATTSGLTLAGGSGFTGTLSIASSTVGFNGTMNLSKSSVTMLSGGSIRNDSGTVILGSLASVAGVGSIGATGGAGKTLNLQVGLLNANTTYGGALITGGNTNARTGLQKVGSGTFTLSGAATANSMANGVTIQGGTLQVGDGSATAGGFSSANNALTFADTGRFNYQGASAGSSQSMAGTTFTTGAGTVQSTYGTSGNTSLTLANVVARSAGATGNFVVSGGANGSTNKIVFTQVAGVAPTTGALLDKGFYFNGADFAAYATGGFVRALAYGADTNAAAVDTITASNHVKLTSTSAAQNSISLLTLNLAGSGVSWANNAAQTLTVSGGGLIKSGGGTTATISGGTGLTTGGATELVVRTDTVSDLLDFQTAILSSSTGGLAKAGAGTLTLSATGNAYTGATYVDEGILKITGTANSGSGIVNVNNTGVFEVSGSGSFTTTGTMIVGQRSGNGTVNLSGGSLSVGALIISNSTVGTDNATGTVNVTGGVLTSPGDVTVGLGGTQTGKLVIDGGTVNVGTTALRWLKLGQWDTSNGQIDINSGALSLNTNSDIKFNVNTGSGTNVINQNGGTVTSYSGNGTGTAGSAADGAIDMQTASTTLVNNTYNLNGGALTINRVFSTSTNGTRTFNFNGGTLKAASGLAGTFFNLGSGNARANVRNGGAIIDTNGFNVNVAQALLHSNINGDNATDGGLTKNNTGIASTLTLSGVNTYTGATTVNAGTLKAGVVSVANVSGAFGNNSAVTMANVAGATLDITGFDTQIGSLAGGGTTGGNVTLGAASLTLGGANQSGTYAGAISSSGTPATSLIKIGTGTQILSGANTYTGVTTISGGTFQIGDGTTDGSIASSSGITNNGSLAYNVVGSQGYANVISGNGTLAKSGAGSLILSGSNTYTGMTTVSAGKLIVSGSIGNSTVTVNNAGTILASGATGTIGSSVVINNGAILAAGDVNSVGTARVSDTTTFKNGSIFFWDVSSNGTGYDKLITAGVTDGDGTGASIFRVVAPDATFADAFWNQSRNWSDIFTTDGSNAISNWSSIFTTVQVYDSTGSSFTPENGFFSVSGNSLTWSAVPEPTSALSGLIVGAGLLRRRRNS